jgi:hypothetical protein
MFVWADIVVYLLMLQACQRSRHRCKARWTASSNLPHLLMEG